MTDVAAPSSIGSGRARGISAMILAGFAVLWFGWGSADPTPRWLTLTLQIGTGAALLVLVLGIVLAVRSPAGSTPMRDPAVRRRYGQIVGTEFALIGIGAVALGNTGLEDWIPVWICTGVGLHFFPLATAFADRGLIVLGILVTAVAGVALVVGLSTDVAPGMVTGVGAGSCLLLWAAVTLADRRAYTGRLSE